MAALQAARIEQIRAPVLRGLSRRKLGLLALLYLVVLVVVAVGGSALTPADPAAQDLRNRLLGPAWAPGGSWSHILGTDFLGRDVLSRIMAGARTSVLIGLSVVAWSGLVGSAAGMAAGVIGGRVESLVMAIADVLLAFPGILLALAIVVMVGPGLLSVTVALGLLSLGVYARMARSVTLSVMGNAYVEASVSLGASRTRLLLRDVLPNAIGPMLITASLELARVILAEAALSFLGLGVQAPTISWGLLLAEGRTYLGPAPWLVIAPGVPIFLTVLSTNIVVQWLRSAHDPTTGTLRAA